MDMFTIMHNDKKVASIYMDGRCTIYHSRLMPSNLCLNKTDAKADIVTRIDNINNFYYWCSGRLMSFDRQNAKEILNTLGMKQAVTDKDRAQIAIKYHCLSLTDVYWVKGFRENVKFSDINLFQNSLSNSFVDVSLLGKHLTAQNAELLKQEDYACDLGTQGVAPKAWIRENDTFYLLKDGNIRDVEAELLASKIVDCFDVNHISYIKDFYDKAVVSKSEIITNLKTSIVSMDRVEIYATNNDTDIVSIAKKYDKYSYYMMNIIDYLIGNTDRHWGNWGLLIDNDNNKIQGLYPLMDFNKAFTSYENVEGGKCQTVGQRKLSQMDAAIEAVKVVGLNQISEVEKDWFDDNNTWQMFNKRLEILKAV